jgi:hypothetical protein
MPGSLTTLVVRALAFKCAHPCCLPLTAQRRHPGLMLSRLNGWPMHSPADASPAPSRAPAHGSGPMRFAIPSISHRFFGAASSPGPGNFWAVMTDY